MTEATKTQLIAAFKKLDQFREEWPKDAKERIGYSVYMERIEVLARQAIEQENV
jgi:hypothetical protein